MPRTLTTKKGRTVETELSDPQALAVMRELCVAKSEFAKSLSMKAAKYSLTYDQLAWVHILANEALGKGQPKPTVKLNMVGILELFTKAKTHLKWPKIRLRTEEGHPVVLAVAGNASKYTGQVMVTDGGKFGQNVYYGRITQEGDYLPTQKSGEAVVKLLERFAVNPAKVAAEYGKLTGNCCFCRLPLTDPKSTSVGYGPICAGHYGLPWGQEELEFGNGLTEADELKAEMAVA